MYSQEYYRVKCITARLFVCLRYPVRSSYHCDPGPGYQDLERKSKCKNIEF